MGIRVDDFLGDDTGHYGEWERVTDADLLALEQDSRHFFDIALDGTKSQSFDNLALRRNLMGPPVLLGFCKGTFPEPRTAATHATA